MKRRTCILGWRRTGEGAAVFAGDAVLVYEGHEGDGDAVLHTWLQVRDHDLLLVGIQFELKHRTETTKRHQREDEDGHVEDWLEKKTEL